MVKVLALFLAIVSLPAAAQENQPTVNEVETAASELSRLADDASFVDDLVRTEVEPMLFNPRAGETHVAGLAFTLEANSDDKKASLRFAFDITNKDFEKNPLSLSFELTSPLDKESDRTVIATPTTLVGMPSGKIGLFWSNKTKKTQQILRTGTQGWLRSLTATRVQQIVASPKSFAPTLRGLARHTSDRWIAFAGATAEGGRQNYKYVNLPDLTEQKSGKTSYIVSLVGGGYNVALESFFTGSLRRVHEYKEQDALQNCVPQDPPTVVKCKTIRNGPPAEKNLTVLDVGLNWRFAKQLGMAPKIAWETSGDSSTFSLPFYFIEGTAGKKENVLNGGLAFDWRRKKDDTGRNETELLITVFIGQYLTRPSFLP